MATRVRRQFNLWAAMTVDDYDSYVDPAVNRIARELEPQSRSLSTFLMKVLGKPQHSWGKWVRGELPLTDRDKRLLKMLASPHWQALLKVLQEQGEVSRDL